MKTNAAVNVFPSFGFVNVQTEEFGESLCWIFLLCVALLSDTENQMKQFVPLN